MFNNVSFRRSTFVSTERFSKGFLFVVTKGLNFMIDKWQNVNTLWVNSNFKVRNYLSRTTSFQFGMQGLI